jgi:hypothetical protein
MSEKFKDQTFFSVRFCNCSDSLVSLVFLLDFGTVRQCFISWFLFDFGTVRQYGISCFLKQYINLKENKSNNTIEQLKNLTKTQEIQHYQKSSKI